MSQRPRSSLLVVATLVSICGVAGCWAAVGIEDRDAVRCGYPFVETTTPICSACVNQNCCAESEACAASADCLNCTGLEPSSTGCTFPSEFDALKSCVHENCEAECYPTIFGLRKPDPNAVNPTTDGSCVDIGDWYGLIQCHPVTNEPCDGPAGEACSFDYALSTFSCHLNGGTNDVGKPCGLVEGLCGAGSDCADNACYRYCCGDEGCGASGTCFFLEEKEYGLNLGLCVAKN